MANIQNSNINLSKYIGKKIMAYSDIYQFSSGKKVRRRGSSVGIVVGFDDNRVFLYSRNNPDGYKLYSLEQSDFIKWINEGKYVRKTSSLEERVESTKAWSSKQIFSTDPIARKNEMRYLRGY